MKMRQEIVEGRVSELAGRMRKKEDTSRTCFDELNDDVQRLYNQSFGALVEERQSPWPDGGWYTKH